MYSKLWRFTKSDVLASKIPTLITLGLMLLIVIRPSFTIRPTISSMAALDGAHI